MNKTKIEWADYTWNPVTGCLHGCEYCYAEKVARRFGGHMDPDRFEDHPEDETENIHVLDAPLVYYSPEAHKAPFPFYFDPTFHRYRLKEPAEKKDGVTIFVCSMADLFGSWVPESWILDVFAACAAAPQHTYLFLTKNPERYWDLAKAGKLPEARNMWYGSTVPVDTTEFYFSDSHNIFTSIEPILAPFSGSYVKAPRVNWVIFGAETGNRKERVRPTWEWIKGMVSYLDDRHIPVFMKNSLRGIVPDDQFRQQTPKGIHIGKELHQWQRPETPTAEWIN